MRLPGTPAHLTYCLNVHPGETWDENLAAIRSHAGAVKRAVCPQHPFGLGLRLAARAAAELRTPQRLDELRHLLAELGLYAFTVNAFPYGNFHSSPVKENVYLPDWTTPERRDYTIAVAEILAALLPNGVDGSISTVPIGFTGFGFSQAKVERSCRRLAETVVALARLEQERGRGICLALEPEPDCVLETTDELIAFFAGPLQRVASPILRRAGIAAEALHRHLGICFDTAHAGVQFEAIVPALRRLAGAGVRIGKAQLSAALACDGSASALAALAPFREPVYLHQTRVRHADGTIARFADLGEALDGSAVNPADEWRVHYHVPLFWPGSGALHSTADQLPAAVRFLLANDLTHHLEIETYTFTVLPPELAPSSLAAGIGREFHWLLDALGSPRCPQTALPGE